MGCLCGDQPGQGCGHLLPMEPQLQNESQRQAKLPVPCGRGPDPTTPNGCCWQMFPQVEGQRPLHPLDLFPRGRGDGNGHWLQLVSWRALLLLFLSLLQGTDLPLEDAVRLGPLDEDPGPEDKVTRAVQAARCPGGSGIPTDTSAKLSSPWMWSSSARGAHSTSSTEQPPGTAQDFGGAARCR